MIVEEEIRESKRSSFTKTIDEASRSMMMHALQGGNYVYPIKSAVRETASNCVDSHIEKEIAINILNGNAKSSDYYEDIKDDEGIRYASGFDKDYYDLNWLDESDRPARITLLYVNDENRDRIKFEDWGVGLGGSRLENFFSLGYSSKRSSSFLTGGKGLGAKAILATDIDSYKMTSYYNGRKYVFDIGETDIVSLIPEVDGNGEPNGKFRFDAVDYEGFYEKTSRKNGVVIEATVVKSKFNDYIAAVKSQLLYMERIEFYAKYRFDSYPSKVYFKVDAIYEDNEILIIPDSPYRSPHILIGRRDLGTLIAYSEIDHEALGIPAKNGSIGLIFRQEELEVSSSRESVLWKAKTRDSVIARYTKVEETAENMIIDYVKAAEDNLFTKYRAISEIERMVTNSSHEGVMANMIRLFEPNYVFKFIPGYTDYVNACRNILNVSPSFKYISKITSTGARYKRDHLSHIRRVFKEDIIVVREEDRVVSAGLQRAYYGVKNPIIVTVMNRDVADELRFGADYIKFVNDLLISAKYKEFSEFSSKNDAPDVVIDYSVTTKDRALDVANSTARILEVKTGSYITISLNKLLNTEGYYYTSKDDRGIECAGAVRDIVIWKLAGPVEEYMLNNGGLLKVWGDNVLVFNKGILVEDKQFIVRNVLSAFNVYSDVGYANIAEHIIPSKYTKLAALQKIFISFKKYRIIGARYTLDICSTTERIREAVDNTILDKPGNKVEGHEDSVHAARLSNKIAKLIRPMDKQIFSSHVDIAYREYLLKDFTIKL